MLETTTIHKCDHCGETKTVTRSGSMETQKVKDEFWGVKLALEEQGVPEVVRRHAASYDFGRGPYGPKAYWCRTCCEKHGLLPPKGMQKAMESEMEQAVTLEDVLREMIQEETQESD